MGLYLFTLLSQVIFLTIMSLYIYIGIIFPFFNYKLYMIDIMYAILYIITLPVNLILIMASHRYFVASVVEKWYYDRYAPRNI